MNKMKRFSLYRRPPARPFTMKRKAYAKQQQEPDNPPIKVDSNSDEAVVDSNGMIWDVPMVKGPCSVTIRNGHVIKATRRLYSFFSAKDGRLFAHGPIAGECEWQADWPYRNNLYWSPGIDLDISDSIYILYEGVKSANKLTPAGNGIIFQRGIEDRGWLETVGFGYEREMIVFAKSRVETFRLRLGTIEPIAFPTSEIPTFYLP